MVIREALRFSYHALRANRIRTLLTALGLVIGNASVILVVTISLTSREYILDQISSIGSNTVYAYYEGGATMSQAAEADFLKISDVAAVREQLAPMIVSAAGVIPSYDRVYMGGREQDITVLGSDEHYASVRNLAVVAGRFLDSNDVSFRSKVALMTERLARRLYGSADGAPGQVIKIHGLQFTVIGVFKEKTESYGLTELNAETVLVPVTVIRYFTPVEKIDPMYVKARSPQLVPRVQEMVRQVIESRHRPGARYRIDSLGPILDAAKKISLVLTLVLLVIAAIALVISGIGIMNIMLVTVTERTREIGVRLAVGATRRDILLQFLTEAVLISVGGGMIGVLAGIAGPLLARVFVDNLVIPISPASIAAGLLVSILVGLVFGTMPASRAARLDPTEALRYE